LARAPFMIEMLAAVSVLLLVVVLVLLVQVLRRPGANFSPLLTKLETLEKLQDRVEHAFKAELSQGRVETGNQSRALREELQLALNTSTNNLVGAVDRIAHYQKNRLEEFATVQKQQLDAFAKALEKLIESNEKKSNELRALIEAKLSSIQTDNAAKLEEMRRTVDEKLQGALDKRLGESFKLVSDRLEAVHKGLGEMQHLATGVGDLKRVLTNVKTRGTWGEIQLGNLLEQILAPEQFERNVSPTGRGTVEFAIKLPGRDEQDGKPVWLPIDAKFPKEDYERLVEASERGDAVAVEQAAKDLETRVRGQARDIRDKYIKAPFTTDFALLYLPTEGLYAEVLRRPGLVESIQRNMRVVVVGPTTLAAVLNSLQLGFRTLAIQKHSGHIQKVLLAVRSDFSKFGEVLEKVKKKLDEAGNVIDDAAKRKNAVERTLRSVEGLPNGEADYLTDERTPSLFDSPVAGK
jgi:DNA recombination protein RmuC